MEPFYKLQPKPNTISEFSKSPPKFFGEYRAVLKSEVDSVLAGKKTVEDAVQSIQERAQQALTAAKQAEEASGASPSASKP